MVSYYPDSNVIVSLCTYICNHIDTGNILLVHLCPMLLVQCMIYLWSCTRNMPPPQYLCVCKLVKGAKICAAHWPHSRLAGVAPGLGALQLLAEHVEQMARPRRRCSEG